MPVRPAPALRRAARLSAALVVAVLALVGGCDSGDPETPNTLAARLADTRDFGDLATVLATARLSERLDGDGPFTVFAPSDAAFDALGDGLVGAVLDPEQRELLARLLLHHVVPGRLTPDDLADGAVLTTLAGTELHVARVGPVVLVDNVPLDLQTRIEADNGVAYESLSVVLTALSTRERVALSPSLNTFRDLLGRTGALPASGPVTVLAPIDDAFVRLDDIRPLLVAQTEILRRALAAHVLPGRVDLAALPDGAVVTTASGERLAVRVDGERRFVGGVRVLTGQDTADGRVYVLGDVVFATLTVGDLLRIQPRAARFATDVRRYADAAARLDDPTAALTVFAPSTGTYQQRGTVISQALGLPENAALQRRVPLAHIVEGRYRYDQLTDGLTLPALDGTTHTVRRGTSSGPRFLGIGPVNVEVPQRAFEARNGILYVVTTFIRPAVDPLDTGILLGLTLHAQAVHATGLTAAFRALDGTVFAFPNSLYQSTPGLISRSDLVDLLRYHATEQELLPESILSPDTTEFLTLSGRLRRAVYTPPTSLARAFLMLDGERLSFLSGTPPSDPSDEQVVGQKGSFLTRAYDGVGALCEMTSVCEIALTPRAQCPPPWLIPLP